MSNRKPAFYIFLSHLLSPPTSFFHCSSFFFLGWKKKKEKSQLKKKNIYIYTAVKFKKIYKKELNDKLKIAALIQRMKTILLQLLSVWPSIVLMTNNDCQVGESVASLVQLPLILRFFCPLKQSNICHWEGKKMYRQCNI